MAWRIKGFVEHVAGRRRKRPADPDAAPVPGSQPEAKPESAAQAAGEQGGPEGPEPTRYGDWEIKGRCIDF